LTMVERVVGKAERMETGGTGYAGWELVLLVLEGTCTWVGAEGTTEIEMDPEEDADDEAEDDEAGPGGAEGGPWKMSSCAPGLKPLRRLYAGVCEPLVTTLFPVN